MTQEQSVAVYDSKELAESGYTIKDCDPIDCKGTIYWVLKPELRKLQNERIRVLAEQAGYKHPDAVGMCEDYAYFDHEKFAQLIVQECAEVAGKDVRHFVLKHFGVE